MEGTLPQGKGNGVGSFLQPFAVSYEPYDYHVMLYFKGHSAYESVEAMIREHGQERPYIRVIMTRHDQSQVDYINDLPAVERLKAINGGREFYYTPVQYTHEQSKERHRFLIKYYTCRDEEVLFDFRSAGKALARFAGLVDPKDHSRDSSLPIMYREKSTLAGPDSKITLNGTEYKIPLKIWIPLFFKGMKGYYSESFVIGVIRRSHEQLEKVSSPAALAVGEKWVYRTGNRLLVYQITKITRDQIILENDSETIFTRVTAEGLGIEKLLYADSSGLQRTSFTFSFNPALPVTFYNNGPKEKSIHFTMTIKDSPLVTGMVTMQRQDNTIKYFMKADEPKWATRRMVCTLVKEEGPQVILETSINTKLGTSLFQAVTESPQTNAQNRTP